MIAVLSARHNHSTRAALCALVSSSCHVKGQSSHPHCVSTQVTCADELMQLMQERDGLAAACAAAQDAAADMQQQNRYVQAAYACI